MGAAIAAGSQEEKGYCALLVNAANTRKRNIFLFSIENRKGMENKIFSIKIHLPTKIISAASPNRFTKTVRMALLTLISFW